MSGKLLAWLMLEGIVGTKNLRYKHVGLFRYNRAAELWTQTGAAKKYAAVGHLLRFLALRKLVARASQSVADHVAGYLNVLGDIIYRSFSYSKQWHCINDSEFISLINSKFSLPHQRSCQGFRLSFTLSTKVISELGTKAYPMGEWEKLCRIGKGFGGSVVTIANPLELNHTWRK